MAGIEPAEPFGTASQAAVSAKFHHIRSVGEPGFEPGHPMFKIVASSRWAIPPWSWRLGSNQHQALIERRHAAVVLRQGLRSRRGSNSPQSVHSRSASPDAYASNGRSGENRTPVFGL